MTQPQAIDAQMLQSFVGLINNMNQLQQRSMEAPLPPVSRKALEAALQADKQKPKIVEVVDENGRLEGQKQMNRVHAFTFFDKYVNIRTTEGANFDMPLHVDREQALRIFNMDFSLDIEIEEDEEPAIGASLSEMKMQDLRELADTKSIKFPLGTSKEQAIEILKANGFSE